MSAIEKIKAKARADVKHIVLPEGTEPRTVQASAKILKEGVARVTLLGNPDEVRKVAAETGTDLTGVAIIDPATSEKSAAYAELLYELRKAKGMTPEQATELVTKNTLYYGAVMLKAGDADGMVAGAINSTGNVLRPALQIIKTAPGIKVVSSCFIMELPDGYDTVVEERGSTLSAGQRQLISFARALLADPKILILDEATSSIDTETERVLQKGLNELLKGRTSFIIAHRLSTIKNADCIMYVENGGIIERGTHDELLALKGKYYELYMSQFDFLK